MADPVLEFPVELEGILSFTFDSESFKRLFEYILQVLKKHDREIAAVNKDPSIPHAEDHGLVAALQQEIDQLKGAIEIQGDKLNSVYQDLCVKHTQNDEALDSLTNDVRIAHNEVAFTTTQLRQLKEQSGELCALLTHQAGKEASLKSQQQSLTSAFHEYSAESKENYSKLLSNFTSLEALTTASLSEMKSLIPSFEPSMDLSTLESKLHHLTASFSVFSNTTTNHFSALNSKMTTTLRHSNAPPQHRLSPRFSPDLTKINSLNNKLSILENTLKEYSIPEGSSLPAVFADVSNIRVELDSLKETINKQFNELKSQNKPVAPDLSGLENQLNQKLIDLCDAMNKRFATKAELKKSLHFIENTLKATKLRVASPKDADAFFSKKQLGEWACASCEQNIETSQHKHRVHQSWNKLPQRDPPERLSKVGPGFSKLLSTLKANTKQTVPRVPSASNAPVKQKKASQTVQLPTAPQERPDTAS